MRPDLPKPDHAKLWCAMGNHWIGDEPYSFFPETAYHNTDEAYCLKCRENSNRSGDKMIEDGRKQEAKEIEWKRLTEAEQGQRRAVAEKCGTCPQCDERLLDPASATYADGTVRPGTCPLCCCTPHYYANKTPV